MPFKPLRRRAIAWLCIAAALLLGVNAQLHGLSHAVQAVQAAAHQDPLAAHAAACEQCLLFAALDGAVPAPAATPLPAACATAVSPVPALPAYPTAFTAYVSRAPPPVG